jgi:hypothetical protein
LSYTDKLLNFSFKHKPSCIPCATLASLKRFTPARDKGLLGRETAGAGAQRSS